MNNLINLFKDFHGMLFCILFVLNTFLQMDKE